ncbi:MAG: glycosyltransferase family 2 protein [Patescibacteria group bacterium]
MQKISVIVINWNVSDSFERCIKSILETKYPDLELILIDNDSHKKPKIPQDPRVTYIQNKSNIGFPAAVNQGLKLFVGDYVLLLNPDTKLPKDFFETAIKFIECHPQAGVMGPKFESEGSVFPEPSIVNTISEYWFGHKGLTEKYTPDKVSSVNAVSGACMFMPRKVVEKVGLFTDQVFMYYEDLDYCRRLRKLGYKVMFNPEIQIFHEHGQSAKQTSQDKYRNFLEILAYPFRKILKFPNTLLSTQRYRTEAGIWYNGWLKQLIMAFIIWSSERVNKKLSKS